MFTRLICFCLCSLPTVLPAEFPLMDLAVDQALLLPDWRFKAEPPGSEVDWSTDGDALARAEWPSVPVPGIWDKGPGEVRLPIPEQAGWFRTRIPLPGLAKDQELSLCFLGVKYTADVFVNGKYLGVRRGGYTPFLFTLPAETTEQSEIEIVVRVDNRLTERTVPKHKTGWETYGGIDREVYLLIRPQTRPENLFVRTYKDKQDVWQLHVKAETVGDPQTPLTIKLLDKEKVVSSYKMKDWLNGIDLSLSLDEPQLWSPEHPHLYHLELSWGKHQLRFPVGIRQLEWKEGKLHLNGEPIWLQGFGQHEFYPKSGSILRPAQRRADLENMKNLFSANALRTGHYPHHPDLFNLADEIGLLLFTEVPAWQIHPQFLTQPDVWDHWVTPQIDEMLLRYRNHPSVFGWGVLNEIGDAHDYIRMARSRIQSLDPTRGVAAVIASTADFGINEITDFAARNLHYGWYHSRSVYKLREGLDQNLRRANGRPIWVAELGGMSTPGRLGGGYNDELRGTETYQDKMTRFGLQYIMSRADDVAGISLWTWSDYERGGSPHFHGVLSADRQPKLAAYTAVNLMRPPFVALGTERESSVAVGASFQADLSVFARHPSPGKRLKLIWQIRSPVGVEKEGDVLVTLDERHNRPAGQVNWLVSESQSNPLTFLYLELQDADGTRLHSQAIPFEAGDRTRPGLLRIPPHPDGKTHPVKLYGMTLTVYPLTGLIMPLPPGDYELTLDTRPRSFQIQEAVTTDLLWDD
jgi:beta-glucuronidase